jgi:hypothetical protein
VWRTGTDRNERASVDVDADDLNVRPIELRLRRSCEEPRCLFPLAFGVPTDGGGQRPADDANQE